MNEKEADARKSGELLERVKANEGLSRQTEAAKAKLIFEMGVLPPDHEVQRYIDRLTSRLRTWPKFKDVQILVAPDWLTVNACALPDGTVFLSGHLIKETRTEQALLGVVAHELIHVYKRHTEANVKKDSQVNEGLADIEAGLPVEERVGVFMERISMERIHEYEADLRGVIEVMDAIGENPIGYKQFLEDQGAKSNKGSITHGTMRDRALNILEATFALHLPSTAQPLKPIPADLYDSVAKERGKYSQRAAVSRPSVLTKDPELQQKHQEKRRKALETIQSKEDSMIALNLMGGKMLRSGKTTDEEDVQVLQQLLKQFAESFDLDEANDPEVVAALSSLAAGVSLRRTTIDVSRGKKSTPVRFASLEVESASTELFEKKELRTRLEQMLEQRAVPFCLSSSQDFFIEMTMKAVNRYQEKKGGSESETEFIEHLKGWSELLSRWSEVFEIQPKPAGVFVREAIEIAKQKRAKGLAEEMKSLEDVRVSDERVPVRHGLEKFDRLKSTNFFKRLKKEWKGTAAGHEKKGRALAETLLAESKDATIDDLGQMVADAIFILNQELAEADPLLRGLVPIARQDSEQKYEGEEPGISEGDRRVELGNVTHHYGTVLGLEILNQMLSSEAFVEMSNAEKRAHLYRYYSINNLEDLIREGEGLVEGEKTGSRLGNPLRSEENTEYWGLEKKRDFPKLIERIKALIEGGRILNELDEGTAAYLVSSLEKGMKAGQESWHIGYHNFRPEIVPLRRDQARIISGYLGKRKTAQAIIRSMERLEKTTGVDVRAALKASHIETGPYLHALVNSFRKEQWKDLTLKEALYLADTVANPVLTEEWKSRLLESKWPTMDFKEKAEVLFPKSSERSLLATELREQFFDEEITDGEDLAYVRNRVSAFLDRLSVEGDARVGTMTLLDKSFAHTPKSEVADTFFAFLNSGKDDRHLKAMILNATRVRSPQPEEIETSNATALSELARKVSIAESALLSIYSMDETTKHWALRKLLTADGGLLKEDDRREYFLDRLFKELITESEDEESLRLELDKIREQLSVSKKWDLIYVGLQKTLRERIARPPRKGVEWLDLYEMEQEFGEVNVKEAKNKRLVSWKRLDPDKKARYWEHADSYYDFAQRAAFKLFGKRNMASADRRMTPLAFTKETVGNLSAMGVRFLQNLPLAFDIPEKFSSEFNEVYDQTKGQSKFAAMIALEAQWPDLWKEVRRFGRRIGGGSIVTVYEVEATDGRREVIKVLNPNIEHHIDEIYGLAKEVVVNLAERHGGSYNTASVLLDDIREWVRSDIRFKGFVEKDKRFFEKHNGYRPKNHQYRLRIPKSRGPDHGLFSREEYLPGIPLTKWEELDKTGHSPKEVMALLVKSYVAQIQDGQVLSDIHIGNFAVTEEKEVVVYDRNFFLTLSQEERFLIASLVNASITMEAKTGAFITYLQKEGNRLTHEQRQTIQEFVGATAGNWQTALKALTHLKRQGVRVPLNFTLLLKNLHSLTLMCRKAGFENVAGAYLYKS